MLNVMADRRFADRRDAGRLLAGVLAGHKGHDVIVLALPRGGVPVAAEVASTLDADLDVLVVRKVGVPRQPELAMAAVASTGVTVVNHEVVRALGVPNHAFDSAVEIERRHVIERTRDLRSDRPAPDLGDRTVILVDDGLATGASMKAAVAAVRQGSPARVVVAVPVGPPDTVATLSRLADEIVCLMQPPRFLAVGEWYDDFTQVSDGEARKLLEEAWSQRAT